MGAYSRKPSTGGQRENRVRGTPQRQFSPADRQSIRNWLKRVRFKRAVIGGVRESDVWKKISELNAMYEQALAAERVRYDTLLKERAAVLAEQWYARRLMEDEEQEKAGDGRYE